MGGYGFRTGIGELTKSLITGDRIRVHGDLHLGQILGRAGDVTFIDFEGEPLRPMFDRNRPDSPLRDVAGMLRSFDYAAGATPSVKPEWSSAARDAYLAGYTAAASTGSVSASALPIDLLNAFELDKAVYEAIYESRNRPSWLTIPLQGIERILERTLVPGV